MGTPYIQTFAKLRPTLRNSGGYPYPVSQAHFLMHANTHAVPAMAGTADQSMYGLPEISTISRSLIVERMQASTPVVIR
jgi:hypothetical protein